MKPTKETRTVLVSRLPSNCSKHEIIEWFSDIGPIKKCFLVRKDDSGDFTGVAYITYVEAADATTAVKSLNQANYNNQLIQVKFSRQRDNQDDAINAFKIKQVKFDQKSEASTLSKCMYVTKDNKKVFKERNGRIIIRNLSFKANDKEIRKTFGKFGIIQNINILKKPDGKMVGCAFIQYDSALSARNAVSALNLEEHLGRTLSVDFAVPKTLYCKESEDTFNIKQEPLDESDIKLEPMDVSQIKEAEESEDSNEDNDTEIQNQKIKIKKTPEHGAVSKDVTEKRTLLLTNLSFDTTEEELQEVLSKFGQLKYVLICYDKLTEHPRGTAFAQYNNRESADACLVASEDAAQQNHFFVNGRSMKIYRAMSREDMNKKKEEYKNKDKFKDKRNLYLAAEGTIREGTLAAKSLSKADIDLRNERRRYKQRLLKSLNVFISRTRLCVHNIPLNMTDKELRDVFLKNSIIGSRITEARIMRDLANIDEGGVAQSKGFGFVSFSEHEHALSALRKINNNPAIFSKNKRPVVEFSLENRSALKAREKRGIKSQENNPNKKIGIANKTKIQDSIQSEKEAFVGAFADSKKKGKTGLPTHIGPKIRHKDNKPKISRNQLRRQTNKSLGKKRQRTKKGANPSKKRKLND